MCSSDLGEVYPGEIEKHNRTKHNKTLPCWIHSKSKWGGCQGSLPLSLAALAGVSPALPEGEPSARPWTEANFVVRRTFLRLCLTTDFAVIDAGTLGSPRGGAVMPQSGMTERGTNGFYGQTLPPYVTLGAQTAKEPMRE